MLLTNLTIYTMSSAGILHGGWIQIQGDKIAALGTEPPPYDENIVDGSGLCALPGFIDAHTHLGLAEDSLDFEGDDTNEDSEPSTPHLRALDGINPFDRCFLEAREAGVTTVAVAPGSANPVGGQICVLKTMGNRVDRMLLRSPAAIKFALGENPKMTYHAKNASPVTRMATAAIIRETLAKAKRYLEDLERAEADEELDEPEFDMRHEALIPLLRGEIPAHFHAHRADDICTALRLAEEFQLHAVIVHATDGYLIADELTQTPLIVGPILCDRSKPELRAQTMDNPRLLWNAGASFALTTDHPVTPLSLLPLCAAMAVRTGMEREAALRAITLTPAKILGVEDRVGSLEVGKDADLVLVQGDIFSLQHRIVAVYLNGEKISV